MYLQSGEETNVRISIHNKRYHHLDKVTPIPSATWMAIICCMQSRDAESILGMGSANDSRRYFVTSSLIGWAHTQSNSWRDTYTQR